MLKTWMNKKPKRNCQNHIVGDYFEGTSLGKMGLGKLILEEVIRAEARGMGTRYHA